MANDEHFFNVSQPFQFSLLKFFCLDLHLVLQFGYFLLISRFFKKSLHILDIDSLSDV